MNTNPVSPHLDLGELIAEVNGQPVADQAREHLASCAHCQLEANRWNLIADGIHGLAADAPEAPQPVRPQDARQRRRRPVRYALLGVGSAAAAVVLFLGIGSAAGIVKVSFGSGGGHAPGGGQTALTAVTGCTQLEQASGNLERVNGSDLTVKAANGQLVTVTTTAATEIAMSGTQLGGDITDGASVIATGPRTDEAIAAITVLIGHTAQQHPQPPPGMVWVRGTASDVSATGFTVVTSDGSRVPVTISGDTLINVSDASLSQLPVGANIHAIGLAGPDGTLAARGVAAILRLPPGGQVHISVKDCSVTSINHEILALAGG